MRIEDSQGQIDAMAWKVRRQLYAAGVRTIDLEDIRSELAIAWCIARDSYDPSRGAKFSTYLHRGMRDHVTHWIRRESIGGAKIARSLDEEMVEDGTLHEVLPSEGAGPHEMTVLAEIRRAIAASLSQAAQRFLDLLENPPAELVEILRAKQECATYARSRGLRAVAPTGVTESMVFDLMGLDRRGRSAVYAEIKNFTAKVHQ